ncbi:magnesium and cobalt transport protein CorA [Euzebya sp.]|uniref:magnesium and cobalt transport protein CorA n=1 Tax=Euzebya sp. TaxID=1971409 RepID=UPI0035140D60
MLIGWSAYRDGGEAGGGSGIEDALAARDGADFVWIRMSGPEDGEVRRLVEAFGLPELAVEDAVLAHQRPKLERYGDTTFMVLKPAVYDDASETIALGEVHVFQGPDFAITVRHGDVGPLDEVERRLQLDPELCALGPAAVLYAVADLVVDAYVPVISGLERDIQEIERAVFDAEAQPPTERIYALMREVLDFQRATSSLLMPLDDLSRGRVAGVHRDLTAYFRDVADHARLVHERSDNFRELLNGALQANLALIGLQENQDQRKISAWAAIALVPTIIGGIWGMNTGVPLEGELEGFLLLLAIIASTSGYLYWRLHRNEWL